MAGRNKCPVSLWFPTRNRRMASAGPGVMECWSNGVLGRGTGGEETPGPGLRKPGSAKGAIHSSPVEASIASAGPGKRSRLFNLQGL